MSKTKENKKLKTKIFASVIILIMFVAIVPMNVTASEPKIKTGGAKATNFQSLPQKAILDTTTGIINPINLLSEAVPFNLDMVDAETVSQTGEGVYVAVLDTGLLSNYLNFFPDDRVDIKEEWGIGYTHNVFYVGTGGNFSGDGKFSYGPLKSNRGFITHDNGAPLIVSAPNGTELEFGWGSGHGTHVTSIITGWYLSRSGVEYWVQGVAPNVTIIPVLVLDDWVAFEPDGSGWFFTGGTDEMVAAGIRYVGDLAKTYKVKIVINLSLGSSVPVQIIKNAINYAIANGVIVVASAGNEGTAGMGWPGAYPQVISAAAVGWTQEYLRYYTGAPDPWYWWTDNVPENLRTVDPLGNQYQVYLTDFSSRPNSTLGQSQWDLDVAAPGAAVKGPYKNYGPDQWGYYSVWGTSQAAPHVTAIAALVLQSYPKLKQASMEKILKGAASFNSKVVCRFLYSSAVVYNVFVDDLVLYTWNYQDFGSGFLEADDALFMASLIRR